jgi:hypothetical protein
MLQYALTQLPFHNEPELWPGRFALNMRETFPTSWREEARVEISALVMGAGKHGRPRRESPVGARAGVFMRGFPGPTTSPLAGWTGPFTHGKSVIAMNRIGYWIRDLKDEECCAPQEVVAWLEPEVRSRLAEYLDAGTRYLGSPGYSWCRFFCSANGRELGCADLTDGCWGWPQGLSHYIRAHGVTLPEEFVSHALAHKPGSFWTGSDGGVPAGELTFWIDWCAARRVPAFVEQLRLAREEASARAGELSERIIAAEVNLRGLSGEKCLFAGCGQRALRGMRLCVLHALRDEPARRASSCYTITAEFMARSVFGRIGAPEA